MKKTTGMTSREVILLAMGTLLVIAALAPPRAARAEALDWTWGNPSPQGNAVYGLAFRDDRTGWAVGTGGEILRTDDGGESWRVQRRTNQLTTLLTDILLLTDGTLVACGEGLFRSRDGGYDWEELAVPATDRFLDLCLVPGGGLSAGTYDGHVFVSPDGGDTWTDVGPGTGAVASHVWLDTDTCVAVGQWTSVRTSDGGATWTENFTISDPILTEVFFTSPTEGTIHATFESYRTTDGGATWTLMTGEGTVFPGYRFRTLRLTPDHWLLATHTEGAELYETLDAGRTWERLQRAGNLGFPCLTALPGGRVIIGVTNGGLLWSDDLGRTLHDGVDVAPSGHPASAVSAFIERPGGVLFAYGLNVSFGSEPTWLRSDDQGVTWDAAPYPVPGESRRGQDWLDAATGVFATTYSVALTTDGGTSWTEVTAPNVRPGRVAVPAADRIFVSAGPNTTSGSLYRSRDGGSTWELVAAGLPTGNFVVGNLVFQDAQRGFVGGLVSGSFRAYVTSDGGETWSSSVGLPSGETSLSGFSLPATGTAVAGAVTADPFNPSWRSYRSTDGGARWTQIPLAVAFGSVARPAPGVIVATSSGGIYSSEDDGQTWRRRSSETASNVVFRDARHGVADFFRERRLLATDDVGVTWTEQPGPLGSPAPHLSLTNFTWSLAGTGRGYLVGGEHQAIALGSWSGPAAAETPAAVLPPRTVRLDPPHPNPTNPATDLRFHLARGDRVEVAIYDLAGRRVRNLLQDDLAAGAHTVRWRGDRDDGRPIASGVYLVRITAGRGHDTRKVTVVR